MAKMLAAAGQDRQIRIWASETGELRQTLHEQESAISALAISPDGLDPAGSGTAESSVCLWDLRNGRIIQQLDGHEHGVGALAFSPDGSILASGDNGHRIRLWHTGTRGAPGSCWPM